MSGFRDWVRKEELRPAVLGAPDFAFKLACLYGASELFEIMDLEVPFDHDYRPNIILVFGPFEGEMERKVLLAKKKWPGVKLLCFDLLARPEEAGASMETAKRLGADNYLGKEFVTMENVKECLRKAFNA